MYIPTVSSAGKYSLERITLSGKYLPHTDTTQKGALSLNFYFL